MRGLDENKVYDYLDALADQVQATEDERAALRAENERLQAETERLNAEVQRMRTELAESEGAGDRVNEQIVDLFSQAQLVAEEMVEDVSRDARQRLGQARDQERRIIEEAMQTAEQTRRDAEALIRWAVPGGAVEAAANGSTNGNGTKPGVVAVGADFSPAMSELERIRSFAEAAQAQMQSIMDTFASEVGRFGDAPAPEDADARPAGRRRRTSD
jgi:cell division septum initiation protein DivIVA